MRTLGPVPPWFVRMHPELITRFGLELRCPGCFRWLELTEGGVHRVICPRCNLSVFGPTAPASDPVVESKP